jgi:hypothetical protein
MLMSFRSFAFVLVLALAGAMLAHIPSGAAARTIVCQGSSSLPGGNYYLSNNGGVGAGGVVRIGFTKSSQAAGAGLSPGSCAWTTGAMSSTDPNTICQQNVGAVGFIINFNRSGRVVSTSIGANHPSIYPQIKAPWVPRMFSNSSFAMDVVSVSPSNLENCVFVNGSFHSYRAPTPTPQKTLRGNPHPGHSIRPI